MSDKCTTTKTWQHGSCHCKKIKFKVFIKNNLKIYNCNCSICFIKQNHNFLVDKRDFQFISGQDYLSTYKFNTKQAVHNFCKICGVQIFNVARLDGNCVGVRIYCMENYGPGVVESERLVVEFEDFDGRAWE